MNLKKIHHVAIIASDYKKSKDFYVNLFGLKIIREVYREERDSYKLDLEIGDSQIRLKDQAIQRPVDLDILPLRLKILRSRLESLRKKVLKWKK